MMSASMAELRRASRGGSIRNVASPVLGQFNGEDDEVGEMVAKLWTRFDRRWCSGSGNGVTREKQRAKWRGNGRHRLDSVFSSRSRLEADVMA
jgi:hypothetical protein